MSKARKRKSKTRSLPRRISLLAGLILLSVYAIFASIAVWFVHHPRAWLDEKRNTLLGCLYNGMMSVGGSVGDLTDSLGWTGHDAVYEFDQESPIGSVAYAGYPKRIAEPAPDDIVVLDRGEFAVGWSPSLRHPVWCAYHVAAKAAYPSTDRPPFAKDKSVAGSAAPANYDRCGYDRGHMVPNYAIVTRYGIEAQKKTFLMTNIAPQSPALNRGVWRNLEHRIADLWTARYGEIWVIVGAISPRFGREKLSGTDIDVPSAYYQIIIAQEGMDLRAMAVLLPANVGWNEWAARYLISIDELEELTGLDFLADLPNFIQSPLEAELPSRLWPIRLVDAIELIAMRYR